MNNLWPNENWRTNKAIVATIAFFDVFLYPMTAMEIRQYVPKRASFKKILERLEDLVREGSLEEKQGFYFLSGKQNHVVVRQQRYNYTQEKIKIAKRWGKLFAILPGVKMVAVGNIIGKHNLNDAGDIDFFIVTAAKRIWSTRFILALSTKLLGLRPTLKKQRNKLCLSFFVSENNLNLENLKFNTDPYFTYWFTGLRQVAGSEEVFKRLKEVNTWLKHDLPNWKMLLEEKHFEAQDIKLPGLEKWFKKLQWRLFPSEMKDLINQGTEIIVNNNVLKLHIKDRRKEFFQKYLDNLKIYENKIREN